MYPCSLNRAVPLLAIHRESYIRRIAEPRPPQPAMLATLLATALLSTAVPTEISRDSVEALVRRVQVAVETGRESAERARLTARRAAVPTDRHALLALATGGALPGLVKSTCSAGTEPATVIRGKHGSLIDSFGLHCSVP
jgi:hypothetical protein